MCLKHANLIHFSISKSTWNDVFIDISIFQAQDRWSRKKKINFQSFLSLSDRHLSSGRRLRHKMIKQTSLTSHNNPNSILQSPLCHLILVTNTERCLRKKKRFYSFPGELNWLHILVSETSKNFFLKEKVQIVRCKQTCLEKQAAIGRKDAM